MTSSCAPKTVTRANRYDIKLIWRDDSETVFPARRLRLLCPCATCVDEDTRERRLEDADVPQNVIPLSIELIGHYAIQVHWSDGHSTGIYPFTMLKALAASLQSAGSCNRKEAS